MWKYLKDQRGQFMGGFLTGLYKGMQDAQENRRKNAELDIRTKEADLKSKMLQNQLDEYTQQKQGLADLSEIYLHGMKVPGQNVPSVQPETGDVTGEMQQEPTQGTTFKQPDTYRPATQNELVGMALKASGPKENLAQHIVTNLTKPAGAGTQSLAYGSLTDAMAAKNTSEWQDAFGLTGAHLTQTSRGWQWAANATSSPERMAAAVAEQEHLRNNPGDYPGAINAGQAAANNVREGTSAAGARGRSLETNLPGYQSPAAMPGQATTPPKNPAVYPTSPSTGGNAAITPQQQAGGARPQINPQAGAGFQQGQAVGGALGSTAEIINQNRLNRRTNETTAGEVAKEEVKQNSPVAPGKEKDMMRVGKNGDLELAPANMSPKWYAANGYRTVGEKVVDAAMALEPAKQAFRDFKNDALNLADARESAIGTGKAVAGQLPIVGGTLQQLGIGSSVGAALKASGTIFNQHYEKATGGLRAAASPQLMHLLEVRAPQLDDSPEMIREKVAKIEAVTKAMELAYKQIANGQKLDEDQIAKLANSWKEKPAGNQPPAGLQPVNKGTRVIESGGGAQVAPGESVIHNGYEYQMRGGIMMKRKVQ